MDPKPFQVTLAPQKLDCKGMSSTATQMETQKPWNEPVEQARKG